MDKGVSLVILNLNGGRYLDKFLKSFIKNNTHNPVEIIIIDHSSDDNTDDVVCEYCKHVFIRYIKRKKNFSFSESCNYGAKRAKFEFLLFINNDINYIQDILPVAVDKLNNSLSIGAVGVRLDDDDDDDDDLDTLSNRREQTIQHLGVHFVWNERSGYHRPEQIRHPKAKDFVPSLYKFPLFHAVTGAFLLCRKIDFEALNGFSELYDYGLEDIDFCLRLGRDLFKKCYCIIDMSLQHTEGATRKLGNHSFRSRRINKNHALFREIWGDYVRNLADNDGILKYAINEKNISTNKNFNNINFSFYDYGFQKSSLTILFILPGPMESNNGYQVQLLARSLGAHGIQCIISSTTLSPTECVPEIFQQHNDCLQITHKATVDSKINIPIPDIVHAWTPRENVRVVSELILERCNCPLIIHLEDNEEFLTESTISRPWAELANIQKEELTNLIPKNRYHPINGPHFLKKANCLTMVIDSLARFNIGNVPTVILPPIVDERFFFPRPLNIALRKELGILDGQIVLAYTGNIHKGNVDEVQELYRAVALLNERGYPTVLLRSGLNSKGLGIEKWSKKFEKSLGWVERKRVPEILAAADVLVQPGVPGPFNDERIPCKLPEFFVMGRPVVLPRTNLGLKVEHRIEGFVLDKVDAEGIAASVMEIHERQELASSMAVSGIVFVQTSVQADINVLMEHYFKLTERRHSKHEI